MDGSKNVLSYLSRDTILTCAYRGRDFPLRPAPLFSLSPPAQVAWLLFLSALSELVPLVSQVRAGCASSGMYAIRHLILPERFLPFRGRPAVRGKLGRAPRLTCLALAEGLAGAACMTLGAEATSTMLDGRDR